MELDFQTGKQVRGVAKSSSPDWASRSTAREYSLLLVVLLLSLVPYALLFVYRPVVCAVLVPFVAMFKVFLTFTASCRTDTSHHIRFLLAGSNPIGMTGGSSLLLGAVDSLLDWKEDSLARRKHPFRFAATTIVKFLSTPIGVVLMLSEFAWDVLLLRRSPRIVLLKLDEFFSLARYHSVICPEKSNDIFYADMAYARYRADPVQYQWVRMRSMVFELQHYKIDVEEGVGVAATNLFLQSDVEAYQILKRLNLEEIESKIAAHYQEHPDSFWVPRKLAGVLVRNGRPIWHYLRMRNELTRFRYREQTEGERELAIVARELKTILSSACDADHDRLFSSWHLLRLIDADAQPSEYLPNDWIEALAQNRILRIELDGSWALTEDFRTRIAEILNRRFDRISQEKATAKIQSQRPHVIYFDELWHSPKSELLIN